MATAGMECFELETSSSNSSDEESPQQLENFAKVVVPSFTDDEFRSHFRVCRDVRAACKS